MTTTYQEYPQQKLVELHVDGKVTEADFDDVAARLEAFIARHGKIKLIEIIENFDGFELAAASKGVRFDIEHLRDFSHCAVVTDSGWIGPFTRLLAPFFSIRIRTFRLAEIERARAWLNESQSAPESG